MQSYSKQFIKQTSKAFYFHIEEPNSQNIYNISERKDRHTIRAKGVSIKEKDAKIHESTIFF